jgi:DnaK suppressor protein
MEIYARSLTKSPKIIGDSQLEREMSQSMPPLDPKFIERQKQRLLALRRSADSVAQERRQESAESNSFSGEAHEYEDDAQHLTELELNGQIGQSAEARLAAIDRALEKIAQGTYGYSDLSGKAIELGRLRVIPEAAYTLQEQRRRDGGG